MRQVTTEKKELVAEAQKMITTIRQMEASLDDPRSRRNCSNENDGLEISYPLTRCIQALKEKHAQIHRLHRERFEQVKSTSLRLNLAPPSTQIPTMLTISQNLSKPWNHTHLISNLASSRLSSHPPGQTSPSRPASTSHPRTLTA